MPDGAGAARNAHLLLLGAEQDVNQTVQLKDLIDDPAVHKLACDLSVEEQNGHGARKTNQQHGEEESFDTSLLRIVKDGIVIVPIHG